MNLSIRLMFSAALLILLVWSESTELYMGELARGRHYFVVAGNGTGDTPLPDYINASFARCRNEYGGRLAWFDTPEIMEAVNLWFIDRFSLLKGANLCGRLGNANLCYFILGLRRTRSSETLATPEEVVAASYWTEDPDDPTGAGVASKNVLDGFDGNITAARFQTSPGAKGRDFARIPVTAAGLGKWALLDQLGAGSSTTWVHQWINGPGWNAVCERSDDQLPGRPAHQDLHFQLEQGRSTAPRYPAQVLADTAGIFCGHRCGRMTGCIAFALEADNTCLLYDHIVDSAAHYRTVTQYFSQTN